MEYLRSIHLPESSNPKLPNDDSPTFPRHFPVDSPRFPEPPVYKTFEKKEFFIKAEKKITEYKGSRRSSGKLGEITGKTRGRLRGNRDIFLYLIRPSFNL